MGSVVKTVIVSKIIPRVVLPKLLNIIKSKFITIITILLDVHLICSSIVLSLSSRKYKRTILFIYSQYSSHCQQLFVKSVLNVVFLIALESFCFKYIWSTYLKVIYYLLILII